VRVPVAGWGAVAAAPAAVVSEVVIVDHVHVSFAEHVGVVKEHREVHALD
jgi:hypothetical protein